MKNPITPLTQERVAALEQADNENTLDGLPRIRPAAQASAPALFGVHEVAAAIVRHLDCPVKSLASLRIVNKQFATAAWPWLMLHAVKSLKPLSTEDIGKVLAALDTPPPGKAAVPGSAHGQKTFLPALSDELKGMAIAATADKLKGALHGDDVHAHHHALYTRSRPLQGQAYLHAASGLGKALTELESKAFGRQFMQLANDLAKRNCSREERAQFYEDAMSGWTGAGGSSDHPRMFRQIRTTLEDAVKAWDAAPRGQVWAALAGTSMRMLDDGHRLASVQRYKAMVADADLALEKAPVYAGLLANFHQGGWALSRPHWQGDEPPDRLSGLRMFSELVPEILGWPAQTRDPVLAKLPFLLTGCPFIVAQLATPEGVPRRELSEQPCSAQELALWLMETLAPVLAPAHRIELAVNLLDTAMSLGAKHPFKTHAPWQRALFDFVDKTLRACPEQAGTTAYAAAVGGMVSLLQKKLAREPEVPEVDFMPRLEKALELAVTLPLGDALACLLDAGSRGYNQFMHEEIDGATALVQQAFDTLCRSHAAAPPLCNSLLSQPRYSNDLHQHALDFSVVKQATDPAVQAP